MYTVKHSRVPFIPKVLVPDAILNPPVTWFGTGAIEARREDEFKKYTSPLRVILVYVLYGMKIRAM